MQRPAPDEEILRRAVRLWEAEATPMQRFLREEFDAMMSSARVGMDSARRLYPVEMDSLTTEQFEIVREALEHFQLAYNGLDTVAEEFCGDLVHRALLNELSLEELEMAESGLVEREHGGD